MFCTNCGTALQGASACPACGHPSPSGAGGLRSTMGAGAGRPDPSPPSPGTGPVDPTAVMQPPVGQAAGGYPPAAHSAPPVFPPTTTGPEPEPRRTSRRVIIGAIAAVLAVTAAGLAFALTRSDGGSDTVVAGSSATEPTTGEEEPTTTSEPSTTTTTIPDEVPDLVGMTLAEAEARVRDAGIDLKVVNVADDETQSGTILKQIPEPGEPFEEVVTVNVARPSVKTYLTSMEPVEESDSGIEDSGNATLNATTYTNSLWMRTCSGWPYEGSSPSVGYDLSRASTRFHAVVGMDDDQVSGSFAQFRVYGDGRLLADQRAALGEPVTLDVDVSGVLRLTIQATGIDCRDYTDDAVHATWGDPYLTAPPSAD